MEIYKEEVRDLLEVDLQKCQGVRIREDQNGNTGMFCYNFQNVILVTLKQGSETYGPCVGPSRQAKSSVL